MTYKLPEGYTTRNGRIYDECGEHVEWFDGKWTRVLNADRTGWWRYHEHYDRDGYCDNPGRGY